MKTNRNNNKIKLFNKKELVLLFFVSLIVLSLSFFFSLNSNINFFKKNQSSIKTIASETDDSFTYVEDKQKASFASERKKILPLRKNDEKEPDLSAEAATVYDIDNKKYLLDKNSETKRPIASLTKLMTVYLVNKYGNLNDQEKVGQLAYETYGNRGNLYIGETLLIKDYVSMALITSSNDSAVVLADYLVKNISFEAKEKYQINNEDTYQMQVKRNNLFKDFMNKEARYHGLDKTYYVDSTGLNESGFSTAADQTKLFMKIIEEKNLLQEMSTKDKIIKSIDNTNYVHDIKNTNEALGKTIGIVGGKTGTNYKAKENIIVLWQHETGRREIITILNTDDRYSDLNKIIQWLNQNFEWI